MKNEIKVILNGRQISALPGRTLSEIISGERPCGGHGKCGKCRVKVWGGVSEPTLAERSLLSEKELASGIRLACLTRALGDCRIERFTEARDPQIVTQGFSAEFALNPVFTRCAVAMDIGTTTLVAQLFDPAGNVLAKASRPNPQARWGADVISRIEAALNGDAVLLTEAIRNALNEMILEFSGVLDPKEVDAAVITGNTVMLSLLTGQSLKPFARAPFDPENLFGQTLPARVLSLSALESETPVYLPPCISAFVGGDITCAILATGLCDNKSAMLADLGTNGEMAVWHDGRLTVTSTAAGPAFEGVGITMGMQGAAGAIDRVENKDGTITAHVIGEQEAMGICGSGLVDAAACMLDMGILDESGYLEEAFVIRHPVSVTPKDIRMLQLAKSAICAGMLTLMYASGVEPAQIPQLYVAGGFGNYLNTDSAVQIGLLPQELAAAAQTVGNAAISGAAMLLLDATKKAAARELAQKATVLDLSTSPVFSERYMMGMMFEKTSSM